MPGGMPGGAGGMDDMMKMLFSDPEIMALMSQPGVGEAIQEIMSDPQGGLAKHQGNPAVMAAFQKYTATILLASGLHSSQHCCGTGSSRS